MNPHEGGGEVVHYETESGGAVFSVGSINWICSLPIDDEISTITANVVRRFAETPSGRSEPQRMAPAGAAQEGHQ